MKSNLFQQGLEYIYNKFNADTAKMLIYTGTIGWILSSAAQIGAVIFSDKLSRKQKSFLVPQEGMDAIINICSFFFITLATQKILSKMVTTGKIAPQKVRNFLDKNKDLYGDKVGKLSLNLDDVLKNNDQVTKESYTAYKNYITTMGTVGASILSTNIVTPIVRNYTASDVQRRYLTNKPQVSGCMKI